MVLAPRIALTASMVSVVVCALALSVSAPEPPVGVVTNVEGTATVARVALAQPQQLRFRDEVFLRDRITTGDQSIVRVLLGGKATITARERSVVTITEAPGVSTVELSTGRIAVAVSKAKMNPGEIVEIRTPNAVTAVRGTVGIAEVWPGNTVRSTITVLRGLVDVTRLDAGTGRPVGLAVDVAVRQSLTVTGASPLSRPTIITPDDAARLTSQFRTVPTTARTASIEPAVQATNTSSDASGEKTTPTNPPSSASTSSTADAGSTPSTTSTGNSGAGHGGKEHASPGASVTANGESGKSVSAGGGSTSSASHTVASVAVVVRPPVSVVPIVNAHANVSATTIKK
ncbi:MAG: hypothetical protein DME04_19895 [Candidatus Rokuibacteriota bacterium]|nr:MAG: hypothetical protein DME04_19895 [Candidatus Rokubacteria bacterium]